MPESGNYVFEVTHTSRVSLEINGREVLTDQSERVNTPREFPRNERRYLPDRRHTFVSTHLCKRSLAWCSYCVRVVCKWTGG